MTTMSSVSITRKPSVITLTDGAIAKVSDLLVQEGNDALALRVAVRPGGCSGYSYEMFFDSELTDDDIVTQQGARQGGRRLCQRRAPQGWHSGVHRRPAGRRVQHLEPQRHPHLRVRFVLQLTHPPPKSAPTLSLRVDGVVVEVPDDGASLLDVLRHHLGHRSPKDGCSPQGQCGCCTVWVDGAPHVACVTPARHVAGREVTTLDGLEPVVRDAWADAFTSAGASQCGFCTPGIIMRLAALGMRRDAPDEQAVGRALAAHLCRCTGWRTIFDAARHVYRSTDAASRPSRDRRRTPSRPRRRGASARARGRRATSGRSERGMRWRGLR